MGRKVLLILVVLLFMALLVVGGCNPKEMPIERIAITSLPRLDYLKGEALDLDNAMVTVFYKDKSSYSFPLSIEMVSEYNPQQLGKHSLTVKYENVFTNIVINISNAPIVAIEPVKGDKAYKTEYIQGQDLDLEHLFLKVYYEKGEPDVFEVDENRDIVVSGYDEDRLGQQDIYIRYLDKYTTTYSISVRENGVHGITIMEVPDKKLYLINEKIEWEDLFGGRLSIVYDNGFSETKSFQELFATQQEIDNAFVYDTSSVKDSRVVNLYYGGKKVIFEIKVLIKAGEIEVCTDNILPQVVGTDLSLDGGIVYIEYNNKTNAELSMTDSKISAEGYQRNKVGVQTITLHFDDIAETCSFEITVIDATPEELIIYPPILENGEIKKYAEATDKSTIMVFYQESTVSLDKWQFQLKYNNDTYSAVQDLRSNMFVGEESILELDTSGDREYEFVYTIGELELSAVVVVEVVAKQVLDTLVITKPDNIVFYRGESLILSGAKYTARFNDGSEVTEEISSVMVGGYNPNSLGDQNLTVTYESEYGTALGAFSIRVIKKAVAIALSSQSLHKKNYILGEQFVTKDLVLLMTYDGESGEEEVRNFGGAEWAFSHSIFEQIGEQEVQAKYLAYGGEVLSVSIPIVVTNGVTEIALVRLEQEEYIAVTCLPNVVAGLGISLGGLYLECLLENGDIEYVALASGMLDYNTNNNQLGLREVKITYSGIEILSTVEVIEKEIDRLEVVQQPNKKYYKADQVVEFDVSGLHLKIHYNNLTIIELNNDNIYGQDPTSITYRIVNNTTSYYDVVLSVSGFDTTLSEGEELANRVVTIGILDKSVDICIVVAYKIVTAISWDIFDDEEAMEQPEVTALQGINELSFASGAEFKVIYNDGEFSDTINVVDNLESMEIIGFDYTKSGTQTIDIKYQDVLLSTIVKVRAKDLYSIAFMEDVGTITVTEGMSLDLRNIKIEVTYYHEVGGNNIFVPSSIVSISSSMIDYDKNSSELGQKTITVTFSYKGNETITKQLNFDINVVPKKLVEIRMGTYPKFDYIEGDSIDFQGGTITLHYNNNTTEIRELVDAKKVRSDSDINQADFFILNYGQFNNDDFSGAPRRQTIFITYKADDVIATTSYDIIMKDRMYIQVDFRDINEYDEASGRYYFWYGEEHIIPYRLLGYLEYTQTPIEPVELESLVVGEHYSYKYINDLTNEVFDQWPRDVGIYTIQIAYNANAQVNNDRIHNSFENHSRKIEIKPKNISIVPDELTKVYGELNPQFDSVVYAIEYDANNNIIVHTENVFGYDDDISALGEISYVCIDSSGNQINKKSAVGQYNINIVADWNKNYNVLCENAIFSVTKRKIVVIANSHQKEYGQDDPVFTYTTASVPGDNESGYIAGDLFVGSLLRERATSNNGVGVYNINVGSLRNDNYEISFVSNTFTITQRKLILTAQSYTKVYGAGLPMFMAVASSLEYENPFVYNDDFGVLGNPEYRCVDAFGNAINSYTAVGTYQIFLSGYHSDNYNIEFVSGEISITRRQVNVFAVEEEKIYGEEDGVFAMIITSRQGQENSGIVNNDILVGQLTREAGENVGSYQILQGTLTNDNNTNYDIFYTPSEFRILHRVAQLEIVQLSKEYDGQLPQINEDGYILHNAYGNINGSIQIRFINPSSNKGSYRIEFEHTDTNHILSFLDYEYTYRIVPKAVSPKFYNIPYGSLENGQYTGSVYKDGPYYYQARVTQSELCFDDIVNVNIETAEIIGDAEPIYLPRDNAKFVGRYSVRIAGLDNPNYVLKELSQAEIEQQGDYRVTEFAIIPVVLKVFVTVPNMSKQYNRGNEVTFHNTISYDAVEGLYKSEDYKILTEISFVPNITVFPYYVVNVGQENEVELPPKNVLYEEDEFGNGVIKGYNIKVESHDRNYVAMLVDIYGQPLELDDGEIVDQDYRLKIIPLQLSFSVHNQDMIKSYDGRLPEIGLSEVAVDGINKAQHLKFRFVRIDNLLSSEYTQHIPTNFFDLYADYNTPDFMQDKITNADCGLFYVIPYSTDPNYEVKFSESSRKVYVITRITLETLVINNPQKVYDGQMPTIHFEQIATDYFVGDPSALRYELIFVNNEQDFYASEEGYEFSIRFLFPDNIGHSGDGYEQHLDFNHKFQNASLLQNFSYKILKKDVFVSMDNGENVSWKYYNGLAGALYYVNKTQNIVDDMLFQQGYTIEDSRGSTAMPNGGVDLSQLFKDSGAILSLGTSGLITPQTIAVNTHSLYANSFIINNFNISPKEGAEFIFTIRRQIIEFYIEDTQKYYGESLQKQDYNYVIDEANREKLVLPVGYGSNTELFGEGATVNNFDYIFQLSYLSPYASVNYAQRIDYLTSVGSYEIGCGGVIEEPLDGEIGIYAGEYYILVFKPTNTKYVTVNRRKLPVSFVDELENYYTVNRIYGYDINEIIFTYKQRDGDTGLIEEDIIKIQQGEWEIISPQFVLSGVALDKYTDVGIYENVIQIDFSDSGTNQNYEFIYPDFYDSSNNAVQPRLKIQKDNLYIQLVTTEGGSAISGVYGSPPSREQYSFVCIDSLGREFDLNDDMFLLSSMFSILLPAITIEIEGQVISFEQEIIDLNFSQMEFSLIDILWANFHRAVVWDNDLQRALSQPVSPELIYKKTIQRQATNGIVYAFEIAENVVLKNYQENYIPIAYTVNKRPIDVSLQHLSDDMVGEEAQFNILWNEKLQLIDKELVVLYFYGASSEIDNSYAITEKGMVEILLENFSLMDIVLSFVDPIDIIFEVEGEYLAKKFFLDALEVPYDINDIDVLYASLVIEQFEIGLAKYDFQAVDNAIYQNYFSALSIADIQQIYDVLVDEELINYLYATLDILIGNEGAQLQHIQQMLFEIMQDTFDLDQHRLLYTYIFDLDELVYDDNIGIGYDYAIDTVNLSLNYNTNWGEHKSIKAQGLSSDNYNFNYVSSTINIYRYVTSVGITNYLPNIMVKGTDAEEDFLVRVNYIDGNYEYLNFKHPEVGLDFVVDYERIFNYLSSNISMNQLEVNQQISIKYYEKFFGYKEYSVEAQPFLVRVKDDKDKLLWTNGGELESGNTGGTFVSTNGNKSIGDKISGNYTYYMADGINNALYNFDVMDIKFRLEPRNQDEYYFDIILNGDGSGNNYLALRLASGKVDTVELIGVYGGVQRYFHTVPKPAELDLFDGRNHEITAYIDKLGSRENDATGYRLLIIIDNSTYINFTNLDKTYPPQELSVAGFQANECNVWISAFRVLTMGIKSSRAIKVLPTTGAFLSQSYSISEQSKQVDLRSLVQNFTFHSSSYLESNIANQFSYEFYIDNQLEDSSVTLDVGVYKLLAKIYYNNILMDSMEMYISISNKFYYESLQHNSVWKNAYMSKPLVYYGHSYQGNNELESYQTSENIISARNLKDYSYQKLVFKLDIATRNGELLQNPFNTAILLKTTDVNVDITNPQLAVTAGVYGVGIYIRAVQVSSSIRFLTKVVLRKEGALSYTEEIDSIDWSAGRVVVESIFDSQSKSIVINIKNDVDKYTIRLAKGVQLGTYETIIDGDLDAIINHTAMTSGIKLRDARIKLYQIESGYRKLVENNYYDYDSGEFVVNTSNNFFASGSRIFLDNGNGLPMVANYETYNITFSATATTQNYEVDYFRMLIGSNMPHFDSNVHNRGIYIGYRTIEEPDLNCDVRILYFGIYKATSSNVLRYYAMQHLAYVIDHPDVVGTHNNIPLIDDLLDGNEYTITVRIDRNVTTITDSSNNNVFKAPMQVYLAQVYLNGELLGNGYIPYINDLSNWYSLSGSLSGDNAVGLNYDTYFLNNNLYAGLELLNANMNIKELVVI